MRSFPTRRAAVAVTAASLLLAPVVPAAADSDAVAPGVPGVPSAVSEGLTPSERSELTDLVSGTGVPLSAFVQTADGPQVVTLDAASRGDAAAAAALLQEAPAVVEAAVSVPVEVMDAVPASPAAFPATGDPDYTNQQWGPAKVRAVAARAGLGTRLPQVVVAVLDTGVSRHQDISSLDVSDAANADFTNDAGDATNDGHGHGTHVAGTIAAGTGNGGTDGVAPGVRILPVKVLPSSGPGSSSWVAQGVTYAATHGADVINMSLGGPGRDPVLEAAIADARQRGVTVVASVGNSFQEGNPVLYPGASPGVVGVAATDSADGHAVFSETGAQVDVAAPGVSILAPYKGGAYMFMNGTSMAAPHVSAVAALVRAAAPTATPDEVEAALQSSATDLGATGRDDVFGHGLVDAAGAVLAVTGGEPTPGDPGQAPTTVTTDAVTTAPRVGTPFTLTGRSTTAAGTGATGTVSASVAGSVVATATPDGTGRFSLTWTPAAPGSTTVTLAQAAAPGVHSGGSTSVTLAVTGAGATTTTAAPVTVQVGQAASLAVSVTSADAPASGVTGTVVATVDGVQVAKGLVSRGAATLRLSKLGVGSRTVVLAFTPAPAARGAVALVASTGSTTVTTTALTAAVTAVLKAPSATVAERATATVVVKATGATPSGTVTVLEGDEALGSGVLKSGKAVVSLPLLPLGEHVLMVVYSGDAAVAASSAAGPTLTVTPKPVSVITAKASAATTATQATLTVTAKVGSKGATGEVAVSEGGTALGTVKLSSGRGTLKLDRLTAGTHALTLTHADGELFTGGTGTVDVVVTPAKATVKAALVAKTVSAGTGTSVSVAVSSAAGTPTGTVKLLEGSTEVATAELSGGSATLAVPSDLAVGSHRFTVAYSGSSEVLAATASAGSLTVRR